MSTTVSVTPYRYIIFAAVKSFHLDSDASSALATALANTITEMPALAV